MNQAMQVLTSQNTVEWYTPPFIIDDARLLLKNIDLDPASAETPQQWIKAARYFSKEENGLNREWKGNVFLNPPYGKTNGKSDQAIWSNKLISEYEKGNVKEAILLINSAHGYKWYENIYIKFPVCQIRERLRFINAEGKTGGQAKKAQTIVYFGQNLKSFNDIFKKHGRILFN